MNPLLVEAIGSVLRAALNIGAGWLVAHGIWKSTDAEQYVAAAALALISIGWSLYQKYGMRAKLVTALAMPAGASEDQAKAAINDPGIRTPSVTLQKHEVPLPLVAMPKG